MASSALAAVSFLAAFFLIPTFPEKIPASVTGPGVEAPGPGGAGWELAAEVKKLRQTSLTSVTTDASVPPPSSAPAGDANGATRTAQVRATPAGGSCASVIAAVEARGLFPAPGFTVVCPGNAMGHAGMTCLNVASVCPGRAEIVIGYVAAYVVSNEFENSRILAGAPARCHEIDCGHLAYGF